MGIIKFTEDKTETIMGKANITDTSKAAASNTHSVKPKPIYDFVKRVFDIVCSLIGLIVLSPVFIILSILIKTTSEGPAFFAHKRVGKGGKTIKSISSEVW